MSDTKICHPLRHNGATRLSRLVQALSPDFFRLDERSIQDLITATYRYAQTLRYFNRENQQDGHWDCFWEVETLTFLAVVAAKDTKKLRRQYDDAVRAVREMQKVSPTGPSPASYLPAVEQLFALALSLEQTYQQLKRINHPLQTLLLNRIKRDNDCDVEELEGALRQLIALHKAADPTLPQHWDRYSPFFATLQNPSGHWGVDNRVAFDSIKVNAQINEKALRRLFLIFYDAWVIIKNAAQSGFDTELARMELSEDVEERAVQPHVALYLAFLHLFRHAQNSLNDLGKSHLDYYYEKVLGLHRRPETPDDVWLLFELAQDVNEHLLEQGTLLPAGKDKNGQPLLYETIENWVLRRAQVADLKNTYFDKTSGRILANPDVKKAYAHKAEKPNEKASYWRAMGDDTHLPDGEVGFAIASPQLILREGKRVADVRIALNKSIALVEANYFKIYLSSKEKWIELDQNTAITENSTPDLTKGAFNIFFKDGSAGGVNEMFIRIVLERDDLPVDTFGPEMAVKAGFDTRWPVMKVVIVPKEVGTAPNLSIVAVGVYEQLRQVEIKEIKINVTVTGIKENLIIQSDQGVFDGTQKVFPFGPVPEEGNRFYIGSTEVFQKALTKLQVKFDWIAPPPKFSVYYDEYTKVKFPAPNPKVRIEFVDRADDRKILISRALRNGILQKGTNIKVKITDVNFNPVESVALSSTPSGAALSSVGAGEYEITLPAGFDPYAAGANIEFLFSKNLDEDYEPYSITLRATGASGTLEQPTASFDIVLFPRQKKFNNYDGKIKGIIKNIYGEDLPGALINNQSFTFINDRYELGTSPIPTSLEFTNTIDYETLAVPPDGFSVIDAILYPREKDNSSNDTFSGAVQGTVKNLKIAQDSLKGVIVRARNNTVFMAATRTTSTGQYALAGIIGATHLDFYFNGQNLPQRTVSIKPTIDVQLLLPQATFTTPSGKIQLNVFIPSGAGADYRINNGTKSPITNASFSLPNLDGNEVLTFSKSGHLETVLKLERNTRLEIVLIKDTVQLASPGTTTGNKLEINFPSIAPVLLSGFEVHINNQKQTTGVDRTNPNKIIVNNFIKNTVKLVNNPNYEDVDLETPDTNIVINISNLVPRLIHAIPSTSGKITGRVIDLQHQTVSGAEIEIENQDSYFQVLSDASGAFEIALPANAPVNGWQLTVSKGNFRTQSIQNQNINAGQFVGVLLGHIEKPKPTTFSFKGTVSSSWNTPQRMPSVKVVAGSIVDFTDENGNFVIQNSTSNNVTFSHPLYENLTIQIKDNSNLDVILLPKKVGLKVFEGNVSDVFGISLREVEISTKIGADTFILAKSDKDGKYRVAIPNGVSALTFVYPSFEDATVELSKLSVQIQPGGSKSLMALRMYYGKATNAPLIDNDAIEDIFDVKINALNLKRDIRTQHFEKYSPTLKRGFIRLTLAEGDFLHKEYPKVLLWYAVNAGKEGEVVIPATGTVNVPPVPNEPYTPATNSISLDYTSEQVITGAENIVGGDGTSIDQYFQLLPFNGHKGLDIWKMQPEIVLLYPYKPADAAVLGDAYATGNLFIGLSELEPGGTLSLLIQVAGGTETDPEKLPPDLVWSYLSFDNTWIPFNVGQILKDETRGLTRSGMVQFAVPTTVTNVNTMLDPRYYWLRVAALEDDNKGKSVQALPSIANIRAQVVRARFKNEGNELSHLGQPLPAGLIANLLESRTAVKSVEQPLPSFGGRLPESEGMEFYQRIGERLRHRHRAVTVWDYEHLLLEKFLDLAAAKCIPHTRYKPAGVASQLAPGYVTVAVIPALSRREDPWPEPRFPKGDLDEMRAFLLKRTNLFVAFADKDEVHLQVVNPLYEKLEVEVEVKFKEGIDEAYYATILAEEIRCYISPWLKDSARPPAFGRKLQRSRLLEFIEEREYVEYVGVEKGNLKDTSVQYLGITMNAVDVAGAPITVPGKEIITIIEDICPSTARSIFVAGSITVRTTIPAEGAVVLNPGDNKRKASIPIEEGAATQKSTDTGIEHAKAEKPKATKPAQNAKPTTKKAK